MESMAADAPLDADVLHGKAAADTGGLDDFGPDDYRERLDVYLAALQDINGLTGAGIVNFHAQILQSLKNRLLLNDLLTRHPEIHDIELVPPVVIAGLPRTGTTHLHNLLASRWTDEVREAMNDYLAGHQRGRLGRVETSAEMFHIDEDELRARFAPSSERFVGLHQ